MWRKVRKIQTSHQQVNIATGQSLDQSLMFYPTGKKTIKLKFKNIDKQGIKQIKQIIYKFF